MSLITRLQTISEGDKSEAVKRLITQSTPDFDFFLLITLSILMATIGLWLNSVAIVIGSMLIAPILSPLLSLSLGIAISDYKLIMRSFYTLVKSIVVGVVAAALVTLFVPTTDAISITTEILLRTEPSLMYFLVAVIAGLAISYTQVRPDLSSTLPGVAVSVALIPPVAVIGIGIAKFDWFIISGSSSLLFINIIGIIFASLLSFSLMNLYGKRHIAERTIKKEEKRLEEEKEKAEEFKSDQEK